METLITNGIQVTVEPFFQSEYSNAVQNEFMFAYRITITNHTGHKVRLLSRKWFINELGYKQREVEGEGVVGMQPIVSPTEEYSYVSGSNIHSELGLAEGYYIFEDMHTNELFQVDIPRFEYIYPPILN